MLLISSLSRRSFHRPSLFLPALFVTRALLCSPALAFVVSPTFPRLSSPSCTTNVAFQATSSLPRIACPTRLQTRLWSTMSTSDASVSLVPGRPTWQQTMLRIKDPAKSIPFYESLGFTLVGGCQTQGQSLLDPSFYSATCSPFELVLLLRLIRSTFHNTSSPCTL